MPVVRTASLLSVVMIAFLAASPAHAQTTKRRTAQPQTAAPTQNYGSDSYSSSPGSNEKKIYLGALIGYAKPTGSNITGVDGRIGFGFHGGYLVSDMFSIGGYLFTNSGNVTTATATTGTSFSVTNYGAEAFFYPMTGEDRVGLGARLGLSSTSTSAGTTSISPSPFSFGPFVNYQHVLDNGFSFGADAGMFLFMETTTTLSSGATLTQSSFQQIQFMATVSYWL